MTIAFGGFDGVLKKNLYVKLSDSTAVATVAATTLDSFNKTALDLRDKKVVDIDVAEINRFTLKTGNPATTSPTTKPARSSEITLERRSEVHTGPPMLPATQPIASTVFVPKWPVERSQWQVVSGGGTKVGGDADDIEVKAMLDAFHPLRADKYLGKPAPTTQPVANYSIHLSTVAAGGKKLEYDFKFVNPSTAQEQPLIGDHNGLSFETSRSLLTNLDSTFKKKPASATPPPMPGVPGQ